MAKKKEGETNIEPNCDWELNDNVICSALADSCGRGMMVCDPCSAKDCVQAAASGAKPCDFLGC